MRSRVTTTTRVLIFLPFIGLIICLLLAGSVALLQKKTITSNTEATIWSQYPNPGLKLATKPTGEFQQTHSPSVNTISSGGNNSPPYKIVWAHPTNYGERFTKDINGIPVNNKPIIVLHETDASASSVINFFQEPHSNENVQASYHTLIELDGTVLYLVPPSKRAFGAANSVFDGDQGSETVKTNPQLPPSVNNFAYHVSLETPPDGHMNNLPTHSSYSEAQYRSLAWLIAQSNVPDQRITTHRSVDRSGQKIDPRSFDFQKFLNLLHSYRGF
ncbi:MAG: N-acetylmuramoyl-L-alanine amidase [Stigonema ocellatum SAG 48.90 = DSM 106950]|nr:N-acetylmuramoyl-L-alanine amidase [Stigonema ocellatum SAG 48.90 = DSM 106950]